MASGALNGLSVVEYSQGIMGATCAKALADLGARVIKVEPPEGDPLRKHGPFPGDVPHPEKSGLFLYLNANKQGVTLDVESQDGYNRLLSLLSDADLFISDLQPASAATSRLDYASLSSLFPRLVCTYVTHFGSTGPYKNFAGSDLVAWHMGGLGYESPAFYVTDPEKERPLRGGANSAEHFAGWTAATASMAALFYKDAYGAGQMVDVSAVEAVSNHIRSSFAIYSYDIESLPENRMKSMFPWIWACKDGHVSTSFVLDHWWNKLVDLMGRPGWAANPEFSTLNGRRSHRDEIEIPVGEWFLQHTRQKLYELLQANSIPCFPVHTMQEVIENEQFRSRDFFVEQRHPVMGTLLQPGAPAKLEVTPWTLRTPAPTLGQHNQSVLGRQHDSQSESDYVPEAGPRQNTAKTIERQGKQTRPLKDIRVVDFGWILSVPHCTAWLGTLGAEVLRIESRARIELGRQGIFGYADRIPGLNRSAGWNGLNYSKLDATLNLSKPEAIEIVKQLVSVSDVVVENFAPGVMDRLGLGYEVLREVKPDIIMLSGSTLGATGPERHATGFGPNVCSYAGLPYVSGYADGPPVNLGGNWPDYVVGMMMMFDILSAVRHRNATGQGQYIDVSMGEVVATLMPEAFLEYTINGRQVRRMGNHDPHMAPHNVYACEGQDQWAAIAVRNEAEWKKFCSVIGHPELTDDPRFVDLNARKAHEDALDDIVTEWTSRREPAQVMELMQASGISAGPVMSIFDIVADRHAIERGFVVEMDHPEVGKRTVAGLPAKFSAIPKPAYFPAPLLGQHNDLILHDLIGISSDALDKLVEQRVVY